MADVASVPFINFGLSQQQQAQAGASANLQNQEANVQSQQAQQQAITTELMQRSKPLYLQAISDAQAAMTGTPAANAQAPTGYQAQEADASGTGPTPGAGATPPMASGPRYDDEGAIADSIRAQNYVQPFTPGEQKLYMAGAALASLPGAAANPALLKIAQYQNQFRVANQSKLNQLRSNQLYDVMTAVQDPNNPDPLGALRAVPGQQSVVAQIMADHPNDPKGQADAARRYAQVTAFNLHQYTGNPQELQNGVLIDKTRGTAVTGQDQVLTGLTTEQKAKAYQYANEQIKVTQTDGEETYMPRWQAPVDQGGLGMSPEAYVARQNALALRHLNDPTQPSPGAGTWDAPSAVGNNAGSKDVSAGNATRQPAAQLRPGARAATGPALQKVKAQAGPNNTMAQAPTPTTPIPGPLPATGSPQYISRLAGALKDSSYKAQWNMGAQVGRPIPGAKEGITNYQNGVKELGDRQQELSTSADQALQNFRAAKMIMDSTAPMTGPIGAMEQRIAATLGVDIGTSQGRQEVAKYLVNGAVSQLKQTYGSRPGVFDVKINVEQAFPNIDKMSPSAIRNLLDSQIAQAQYIKDTAARSVPYIRAGLDPYKFGTWNSIYFPRAELLDNQYGSQPPQGAETRTYQGDAYYLKPGTDRTKRENWVKYTQASNG
jgi:hypothetical protein